MDNMNMMEEEEEEANAATAQGDLADVVVGARANALPTRARAFVPSTHHHHHLHPPPPPPPPPAPMPPPQYPAAAHFTIPSACAADATMFDAAAAPATSNPYLSPSGAYGGLQALQISHHALCGVGGDVPMGGAGAAAADDASEDSIRISPLTPTAHHQMIKRKNDVKKVVCIPAPPATSGRAGGGEVIPSDLWAWRKYGQKPIKGSPYPRGYYRCSSSKGCMARKQVERSRSDPNMLVITYTAEHNHPWPMQRNVLAGYARSHHTHAGAAAASSSSTAAATTTTRNNTNKQLQLQLPAVVVAAAAAASATSRSSSSSTSYSNVVHAQQHADLLGGQLANMVVSAAGNGAAGAAFSHAGILQPPAAADHDQVFAELEELEPDNPMTTINANTVYSSMSSSSSSRRRPSSISYDWHKF